MSSHVGMNVHLKTVMFGTTHIERGKIVWKMPIRSSIVIAILVGYFVWTDRPMSAVPLAIGALFAAVADVGEHLGYRWRTMLWTTTWLMLGCAVADLVSDWKILVVVASCAVALLTGFAGSIGMRAGLIGTLVLVVFTVFAGTPEVPWEWLPTALLMGLGGVIQTAVTCLPPLLANPSLIHKPDDAGSVILRLKAHLNPGDPFFRHAVRLSLAIGAGTVLSMLMNHPHAYWIPMTIAWVARPDQEGTTTRVVARILGTMVGLVLVALAVDEVSASAGWVVLVVTLGGALALAFIWANYAIAVVGVTVFVIALFELIGVPVNSALPDHHLRLHIPRCALMWSVHNHLFNRMIGFDGAVLRLNILWMLGIVLLPWPSRLYGEGIGSEQGEWSGGEGLGGAGLLYWGTLAFISIIGALIAEHVRRHPELVDRESTEPPRAPLRGYAFAAAFLIIGLISLVAPAVSVWLPLVLIPLAIVLDRRGRRAPG